MNQEGVDMITMYFNFIKMTEKNPTSIHGALNLRSQLYASTNKFIDLYKVHAEITWKLFRTSKQTPQNSFQGPVSVIFTNQNQNLPHLHKNDHKASWKSAIKSQFLKFISCFMKCTFNFANAQSYRYRENSITK